MFFVADLLYPSRSVFIVHLNDADTMRADIDPYAFSYDVRCGAYYRLLPIHREKVRRHCFHSPCKIDVRVLPVQVQQKVV